MSPTIEDFKPYEEPEDRGVYQLMGANPLVQMNRRYAIRKCSYKKLSRKFNSLLSEVDSTFSKIRSRDDGVFLSVYTNLWMPKWTQGRLSFVSREKSFEGRERYGASAEDPTWRDSLLWDDDQKIDKRLQTIDAYHKSIHDIAKEGLELFRIATEAKAGFFSTQQQKLIVPLSPNNMLRRTRYAEEEGRCVLIGPIGQRQDVEFKFQIKLFNDVYRENISASNIRQMLDKIKRMEDENENKDE